MPSAETGTGRSVPGGNRAGSVPRIRGCAPGRTIPCADG